MSDTGSQRSGLRTEYKVVFLTAFLGICGWWIQHWLTTGDEPGSVEIQLMPIDAQARVRLDTTEEGVLLPGEERLTLTQVQAGERTLTIQAPGYASWSQGVQVAPGEASSLTVQLEPAPPASASLRVSLADPPAGARVAVEGDERAASAEGVLFSDLAPGEARVVASAAGFQSTEQRVTLEPAGAHRIELDALEPIDTRRRLRIVLEFLLVHSDGDAGLEGEGDFVWQFAVQGQELARQDKEVNFGAGDKRQLNARTELLLEADETLSFTGHVTDKDGGMSGSDDTIPFVWSKRVADLTTERVSLRPHQGEDPDVEVVFRLEPL